MNRYLPFTLHPLALFCTLVCGIFQQIHALSPPLFQRFSFASNRVSIRPHIFYTEEIVVHGTTNTTNTNNKQTLEFTMRNVPGEGDCMFLAVALGTAISMGLGGDYDQLRFIAAQSRYITAQVLGAPDGKLNIEGDRNVLATALLASAAKGEGVSPEEYLEQVKNGTLQGGGPELTVLSNVLRRPISVFELDVDDETYESKDSEIPSRCRIKRVGTFGDSFKDPCASVPNSAVLSGLQPGAYSWHLHILVVDAGLAEKHACTLLPQFVDV